MSQNKKATDANEQTVKPKIDKAAMDIIVKEKQNKVATNQTIKK